MTPPESEENLLEEFPDEVAAPFDVEDKDDIAQYIGPTWGEGYYRVYQPGDHQRMNTHFQGWVERDGTWGEL